MVNEVQGQPTGPKVLNSSEMTERTMPHGVVDFIDGFRVKMGNVEKSERRLFQYVAEKATVPMTPEQAKLLFLELMLVEDEIAVKQDLSPAGMAARAQKTLLEVADTQSPEVKERMTKLFGLDNIAAIREWPGFALGF